jgi:hypothetical protein
MVITIRGTDLRPKCSGLVPGDDGLKCITEVVRQEGIFPRPRGLAGDSGRAMLTNSIVTSIPGLFNLEPE